MKIPVILICCAIFMACNNSGTGSNLKSTNDTPHKQHKYSYTCEMDSDVHSDTPGICPKCGMQLIKADSSR